MFSGEDKKGKDVLETAPQGPLRAPALPPNKPGFPFQTFISLYLGK